MRAFQRRCRADRVEDHASGTQLIQELVAEGLWAVTRYRSRADKIMRLRAQTATIENGFVHLPEAAPWLTAYLDELTYFPQSRRGAASTVTEKRVRHMGAVLERR